MIRNILLTSCDIGSHRAIGVKKRWFNFIKDQLEFSKGHLEPSLVERKTG
jgi:hypothetical protein